MTIQNFTDTDIRSIVEDLNSLFGYDFRQYAEAHIRRRVLSRLGLSGIKDIAAARERIAHDKAFVALLLNDLSITVTEMFRDPDFYQALREKAISLLKTYSFLKIWHAGCSTGEEVYSMAILLQEEGLYDRCTIYATDFNANALQKARDGIFSYQSVREYTANYGRFGGRASLSDYYTSGYSHVIMNQSLKKNIVWAQHNLVTDRVFAEVHLVMCRNVLIYFDKALQNKVHGLFYDSLINGGLLCLGSKESLAYTEYSGRYNIIDNKQKIFKKKY